MVGIGPHGVLEGNQGLIGLTLGVARQAQVVLGIDQIRTELNRPLEAQPRLCHPVLVQERQAEVVVHLGQVWLEVQRQFETRAALPPIRPRAMRASPMFEYAPTQSGQSRRTSS